MTTTNDLIEATRGHLQANTSEELNRLNGPIDADDTEIVFKYDLGGIGKQSIIAIDLEEIRVWETDGAKTVTVAERNVNGSTAATHVDLSLVYVKPRFSPFRCLRAINDDLNDLSSPANGLFQVVPVTQFTYLSGVNAYDLTGVTSLENIESVDYQAPGSTEEWFRLNPREYRLARGQNTTEFPSGMSITFVNGGDTGQPYRINYRAPFTALPANSLTTNLTTTGLPSTAYDIPPYGAALALMAGREVKRNFTESQGETRRAQEVPPGAVSSSVAGLRAQRTSRIRAEAARLHARYPTVLRAG